jgi:hypothetical protein
MDPALAGGTGLLIPQTDTSTASVAGNYAFGAQSYNDFCCEFDVAGQGSFTGGLLTGSGLVSDPFLTLGANAVNSQISFSGTPLPDAANVGRYTMFSTDPTPNPFNVTINSVTLPFNVVLYQASGGQLFWLDEDAISVFLGTLQQQDSLIGLPAATKGATQTRKQE